LRQTRFKSKKHAQSSHSAHRVEQRSKKTRDSANSLTKNFFEGYSKEAKALAQDLLISKLDMKLTALNPYLF